MFIVQYLFLQALPRPESTFFKIMCVTVMHFFLITLSIQISSAGPRKKSVKTRTAPFLFVCLLIYFCSQSVRPALGSQEFDDE